MNNSNKIKRIFFLHFNIINTFSVLILTRTISEMQIFRWKAPDLSFCDFHQFFIYLLNFQPITIKQVISNT